MQILQERLGTDELSGGCAKIVLPVFRVKAKKLMQRTGAVKIRTGTAEKEPTGEDSVPYNDTSRQGF